MLSAGRRQGKGASPAGMEGDVPRTRVPAASMESRRLWTGTGRECGRPPWRGTRAVPGSHRTPLLGVCPEKGSAHCGFNAVMKLTQCT